MALALCAAAARAGRPALCRTTPRSRRSARGREVRDGVRAAQHLLADLQQPCSSGFYQRIILLQSDFSLL
jgi:hypothetical protein